MTLLVDAGALLVQVDRDDPRHSTVVQILTAEREPLVTSAATAAEADYLILRRLGLDAELAFLRDLAEGTFVVDWLTRADLTAAYDLARRNRDPALGLADASLVILAQRHRTRRLLTFNERDFRAVTPLQGGAFILLPADR